MDGDQGVVADVGDCGTDHVQVREEREQRPVPRTPRDEVADRIGLDLGDAGDGLTEGVEGELLVPGGAVRAQERVEKLRNRHRAGSLWPCESRPTC